MRDDVFEVTMWVTLLTKSTPSLVFTELTSSAAISAVSLESAVLTHCTAPALLTRVSHPVMMTYAHSSAGLTLTLFAPVDADARASTLPATVLNPSVSAKNLWATLFTPTGF